MFVLDTNILIYYGAGDKAVSDFLLEKLQKQDSLIIPTIIVAEFLSFPTLKLSEQKLFSNFNFFL